MATCYTVARFFLVFMNLILFIIGILVTLVGILLALVPYSVASIDLGDGALRDALNDVSINVTYLEVAAWVCVGLGIIIMIMSLCGCLGGCTLSTALLAIYVFTICLITAVQIGICVIILLSRTWYTDTVNTTFSEYVKGGAGQEFQTAWGALQLAVGCCGVNGSSDYDTLNEPELYKTCCVVKDKIAAVTNFLNGTEVEYVDEEGCVDLPGSVKKEDVLNVEGCIDKLYENITTYAIIAVALLSIEMLIIFLGCIVCCKADDERKPI